MKLMIRFLIAILLFITSGAEQVAANNMQDEVCYCSFENLHQTDIDDFVTPPPVRLFEFNKVAPVIEQAQDKIEISNNEDEEEEYDTCKKDAGFGYYFATPISIFTTSQIIYTAKNSNSSCRDNFNLIASGRSLYLVYEVFRI